ncbi:hypothetical protein [Devosia crocina]|uniref:hypothetical protein n=1 Tax=Devosia crocina TaxID=429728 RepID=UPI000B89F017|nr:hypothetical protein [Devosia crocina]
MLANVAALVIFLVAFVGWVMAPRSAVGQLDWMIAAAIVAFIVLNLLVISQTAGNNRVFRLVSLWFAAKEAELEARAKTKPEA